MPGATWSQLKQGDEVVLTGRLSNGWFRCMAKMDVAASTEQGLDYSHLTDTHEHTPGHGQQSGLLYVLGIRSYCMYYLLLVMVLL